MVTKWATSAAVIPHSKFPGKMLNRFIILVFILDETIYSGKVDYLLDYPVHRLGYLFSS